MQDWFDFGFENVSNFGEIYSYGNVWLVEFQDYTRAIVIEDPVDSPDENYVLEELEGATI